jgi:class 3 adenylate cyclase/tetratricopeptide (TPR) repeat protein
VTESVAFPAASPAPVGQRRLLTLLFVDLSGSTSIAEWMEAEHYAAMLGALRALYERIVPHHGGVIARIQGDGMLAVFGHPEVREDDGRRATEAALELHAAVRELLPPGPRPAGFAGLTLHSGIHAGIVLVNDGDQMRGRFELLGNAPNIAARLSEAARADEIIASEESLGLQSQFFETGARFSLRLRGRATPLAAYRVLGRSAAVGRRFEASMRRGLAPFVGRCAEKRLLDTALQRALAGHTLWLSLRAGAGVGKTRLTEEFLRQAADQPCQIHRGYCESYLSAEPLQPFLQMLRAMEGLGEDPADAPPELFAAQRSAPGARGDALLALLLALARRTPQLVFIDDLQWADDASLRLLHRLRQGAEREGLPLLLLTASRPQPADVATRAQPTPNDDSAQLIELPPLTELEAARAVQQLLPQIDPFVAAEVQRHAGGNPLFIEELCHAAADAGTPLDEAQSSSAWLAALVESRVTRLPPEQARLVRLAAVIGNVIPTWLMEALSGCDERHPAVQALAGQDFIFPDQRPGHLRFKHGITRDVVYEASGLHERQALHRRIGAELRARAQAGTEALLHEQLAYHDAAAHDWPAAARHAEAAGDQALVASALDRAKKQFRAALAALEFLPDDAQRRRRWVGIAQRLGMACVFDASRDDLRVLRHAATLAHADGDLGLIARTEYWLAYVGYALGETRDSLAHAQAAVAAAQHCGDQALLAQLPGTVGQLHAAAADYDAALPMLDEAIARQRPRARSQANQIGLSYSLCCRAYVLGDQGGFAQAHEAFAEALAPFDGSGHAVEASIQGWRAAVFLWQGRWAEARESAAVAHRVGAQVRSMFTCAMGHAAGAYAAWMQEGTPTARQHILDATAWLAPRGGGLYSSFNHGWLADILATQGDAGPARHHVALALRRGRQHDWIGGAMAYRAAARLAARLGDDARARRYLSLARGAGEQRQSAHEAAVNALLEAELRLDARWPAALDFARSEFERMGMTGFLDRTRGL